MLVTRLVRLVRGGAAGGTVGGAMVSVCGSVHNHLLGDWLDLHLLSFIAS